MIFDYSLAALVTAGLLSTSPTLCCGPSGSERVATMTVIGWIQILLYCAIVVALVMPLGGYMTRVFNGERTFLSPVLRPVEAALYWLGGVDEKREQHWLDLHGRHAAVPRRRISHPLCADAPAGGAAVQSGRTCRRSPRTSPSTRR